MWELALNVQGWFLFVFITLLLFVVVLLVLIGAVAGIIALSKRLTARDKAVDEQEP